MNVIEIHDLKKTLGNFHLSIPSLAVPEGYITGFIGENGAGKTTTIKLMMNHLFPDQGQISLFGQNSQQKNQQFKEWIGYVGDVSGFTVQATLLQLKEMTRPFYSKWDEAVFRRLTDRFALDLKKPLKDMSKGQQKQFSLAMALSHHPRLLLMDEPTTNLDPLVRQDFLDILQNQLEQEGVTVFFSSHITSDLDKVADYVLFLHQGQIVLNMQPKDRLLETHRIVKGPAALFTPETRPYLLDLRKTDYGCTALTTQYAQTYALLGQEAVYDIPTLEDVFIGYARGEKQ